MRSRDTKNDYAGHKQSAGHRLKTPGLVQVGTGFHNVVMKYFPYYQSTNLIFCNLDSTISSASRIIFQEVRKILDNISCLGRYAGELSQLSTSLPYIITITQTCQLYCVFRYIIASLVQSTLPYVKSYSTHVCSIWLLQYGSLWEFIVDQVCGNNMYLPTLTTFYYILNRYNTNCLSALAIPLAMPMWRQPLGVES